MTFAFFDDVDGINLFIVDTVEDELDGDLGSGDLSLREAIAEANALESPNQIVFSEALRGQTIVLSLGELVVNGAIFVDGDLEDDGQSDITIDANFSSRIFNIQEANVALEGLTLANGDAGGDGGAIFSQASFDIANSVIQDSFATGNGGGIAVESGDIQVLSTLFSGNSATNGGGLHVGLGSSVLVDESTFSQNTAFSFGGGIQNLGQLNVLGSSLDANQSDNNGGGLFNLGEATVATSNISNNAAVNSGGGASNGSFETAGQLTIEDSTISSNSGGIFGGGIHNANGELNLESSAVTDNFIGFEGGGIAGSGEISNSEISGNTAYEYGGGLAGEFTISSSVILQNDARFGGGLLGGGTLSNSLVNGNTAEVNGAGIQGSDLQITNSTISDNALEADFFTGAGLDVQGTVELANSIISGNAQGDVAIAESGDLLINGVNIIEDGSFQDVSVLNVDPLLGEVANNGGSLPSQALLPDSPAIDAGDNSLVTEAFDQRGPGFNRINDGNGDGVATVDLGAVEAETIKSLDSLYFTLKRTMTVDHRAFSPEDIFRKDSQGFTKVFDGSNVGLGGAKIDAFDVIDENQILLSFAQPITIDGIGLVDDSDIVKFSATSLGRRTQGSFELYFDGSDVGLDRPDEDIDALTQLANGDILVSTKGNIDAPGISGGREDIFRFTPTSVGEETSGTWSDYLDFSDVGLDTTNVNGFHANEDGDVLLSTGGQFRHSGTTIANDDVFGFSASSLGSDTEGTFSTPTFRGADFGLLRNSIGAIDVG